MSLWAEIRAELNGEFWVPAGTLITANGTAVPNGDGFGFPADLARALEELADGMWVWRWLDYPAATFPMGPSVDVLIAACVAMIKATPGKIVLAGYSQSAIAMAYVWRDHIRNPNGDLHDRLDDVGAVIAWGNPVRAPGVAHGNELAGVPVPGKLDGHTTGGIAGPNCLTPEECLHPVTGKPIVLDFANFGDLYAAAPVGDTPWVKETVVGHNETLIYEAVLNFDGHDLLALAAKLAEVMMQPLAQILPLVQAIWNGLTFFAQGMRAPHWTYDAGPAVRHMLNLGARLQAESRAA